jgi:hypothetical protein
VVPKCIPNYFVFRYFEFICGGTDTHFRWAERWSFKFLSEVGFYLFIVSRHEFSGNSMTLCSTEVTFLKNVVSNQTM